MKCPNCGAPMKTHRENHRYTESGLPDVTLRNVEAHACSSCGERAFSIPRMAELHRLLAFAVAARRARLTGAEVRFLRKSLGWSGADFARTLGVDPATVSRWENEKEPMGAANERLLRLAVFRTRPVEEYPTERLAEVAQADAPRRRLDARVIGAGWHVEEAAA